MSPKPVPNHTQTTSENDPLLPQSGSRTKSSKRSLSARFQKHMTRDVRKNHADLILLFCYIITGLLDSSAIAVWGSFVSMQTGNTVYLGLGIIDTHSSNRWIKSGVSIACFCFGSMCFAFFHRKFGAKKRWVLCTSTAVQFILIIISTFVTSGKKEGDEVGPEVLVPIGLVAFQSAGQAVISRAVKFNALTSVVLTSIYCDLFSDPKLFTAGISEGVERNQRISAPVLLLLGVILGGLWSRSHFGLKGALWMAAAMKIVITLTWFLWMAEPEDDEE